MKTNVSVTIDSAVFASTGGGWTLATAPPVIGGGSRPAETGTTQSIVPAGGAGQPNQAPTMGNGLLLMFIPLFLLLILMSSLGARKEKKKRMEMLNALGRYDQVQTMGGMIGTIVEIKGDEIVLKVDEATNTKIHFARSAVQSVLKSHRGGSDASVAETAGAA